MFLEEHLLLEVLESAALGEPLDCNSQLHLDSCLRCQDTVMRLQKLDQDLFALRAGPDEVNSQDCPGAETWLDLAVGQVSQERRETLLRHAAHCGNCAVELRKALDELHRPPSGEEIAFAAGLRPPAALIPVHRKGYLLRYSIAAALAGVAILAWWLLPPRAPLSLIAKAYSEQRTLEPRMPGAEWAQMAVRRSSSGISSPSAAEAESRLKQNEGLIRDNAEWLQARGRLRLIEWGYAAARMDFEAARKLEPTLTGILNDLAVAEYERVMKQPDRGDFKTAIGLLDEALRADPNDLPSRFNRALMTEAAGRTRDSLSEWRRYLKADPKGGWADEAKQHVSRLESRSGNSSAVEQ